MNAGGERKRARRDGGREKAPQTARGCADEPKNKCLPQKRKIGTPEEQPEPGKISEQKTKRRRKKTRRERESERGTTQQ